MGFKSNSILINQGDRSISKFTIIEDRNNSYYSQSPNLSDREFIKIIDISTYKFKGTIEGENITLFHRR